MKSVIGIDPGGRSTGLVLLSGDRLIDADVIERKGKDRVPEASYLVEVRKRVQVACFRSVDRPLLCVEGLKAPNAYHDGKRKPISPLDLVGPAMVLGMILAEWPEAVVVPPGGNGARDWFAYPEQIRQPIGGKGSDRMRHARSAYDVAVQGLTLEVWVVTAAGKREYARVRPLMARSDCAQ